MTDDQRHQFVRMEGQEIKASLPDGSQFAGFFAVGEDSLGNFVLVLGECPNCRQTTQLIVRYRAHGKKTRWAPPSWAQNQKKPSPSWIMDFLDKHPSIGFTCGCYSKMHRQMAHIDDRVIHSEKD